MSRAAPSMAWQLPTASTLHLSSARRPSRWRLLLHPLTAICIIQVVLSLSLVWSNTAFADEAQYLSTGKLEWAHWIHAARIPQYLLGQLSGSSFIYPPVGALANNIGGLAGARILSLLFMLGATILLYLTTSRLVDHTAAVVATVLWALCEPAVRLAFATFDPLSVLLTALSAWLIVQAGHRYHRGAFVTAAAAALALANVTAYSGIIIDPVVIIFAFLVWLLYMQRRRAFLCAMWFTGVLAVLFCILMTASNSWAPLMSTIINRSGSDHQSILLVLDDSWGYSGLIAVLAMIGVITAFGTESGQRSALVALLGFAVLVVPAAQFHEQTAWSLDKHLAYGIWFAVIAAGYGCSRLIRKFPRAGKQLAACCTIALIYTAAISWKSAWNVYHAWPNSRSFINAFAPVAAHSSGLIYVSGTGPENIAEYYTPQGQDPARWSTELSLNPVTIPQNHWESYYVARLRSGNYGVIVLFYATTFSSVPSLPGQLLVSPPSRRSPNQKILSLEGDNPGEPGLPALTLAIESDSAYGQPFTGPYDSANENGVYAIWYKEPRS